MSAPKRKDASGASGGEAQEPGAAPQRGAGSYVREWVNCGSPYCRTCAPGGQGTHGPYWYLYLWRDGKHSKRYIGKSLPQSARPGGSAVPAPEPPGRVPGETAAG